VRDKTEVLRQSVAAGRTVRDKTEVLRQSMAAGRTVRDKTLRRFVLFTNIYRGYQTTED
jgi:hypothetical protein